MDGIAASNFIAEQDPHGVFSLDAATVERIKFKARMIPWPGLMLCLWLS